MLEKGARLIEQYPEVSINDFKTVKFIGRGAFGNVDLVHCNLNGLPYALKQMSKNEIARQNRIKHLMREKDLMNCWIHPNIVRLESTLKDEENWYFVLEYHPIGDLAKLIQKRKKISRTLTRFYAREVSKKHLKYTDNFSVRVFPKTQYCAQRYEARKYSYRCKFPF